MRRRSYRCIGGLVNEIADWDYDSFVILANLKVYPEEFSKQVADDVKFRNILVHDYNDIDKNLIHKKIKEVLDDFNQYSNYILKFIEKKRG